MDPIQLRLLNRRKAVAPPPRPGARPAARPPAKPVSAMQRMLNELANGPIQRSDQQWSELLDPRVKPFTDAIDAATLNNRARSEYQFETQAAANKGLSQGFLGVLTGGKTGADAEAYSKSEFGGSYLGAQAMEIATQNLRALTNDWDDREWAISGEYLKAMQEVPAIREELRSQIEKSDLNDYDSKFKYATLLLDETYRQAQLGEEKRQFNTTAGENKRVNNAQLDMAAQKLGVDSYRAGTDRIQAGTSAKNSEIRAAELALKRAKQDYAKSKDAKDRALAQQRINTQKGNLKVAQEKLRLQKQGGGSGAQKAERQLAVDILKDSARYKGKPDDTGYVDPESGMSYTEAYDYIYALAEQTMPNRKPPYINKWVAARLKSLGYGKVDPKPRRG